MGIEYHSYAFGAFTYAGASAKMTRGPDGLLKFRPHNLLNSATPANQTVTVISGATYRMVVTGTASGVASGAATGTWTAGTYNFTAATSSLVLASASGVGRVRLYRTPCDDLDLEGGQFSLPFEWNLNGTLRGFVREQSATNLIDNSQRFGSGSGWSSVRLFRNDDVGASPDGGIDACKLVEDTTPGTNHSMSFAVNVTTGVQYAFSIWVKAAEWQGINLRWGSLFPTGNCRYDASNGSIAPSGTRDDAYIEDWGNGWYRAVWVQTATGTGSAGAQVFLSSATSITLSGEDGTKGAFVFGAQIEVGPRASSYVPTHGAASVRATDVPELDVASFMSGATEYGMYAEFEVKAAVSGSPYIARLSDIALNHRAGPYLDAAQAVRLFARQAGVAQADVASGATAAAVTTERVACNWGPNDFRISCDGGAVQSDLVGSVPSPIEVLNLGFAGNFGLKKIHIYKRALTNGELISLSTNGVLS